MAYYYLKALHIVFVVTWFAGMFYMPRLFIYATEANDKPDPEKSILQAQFKIMMRRLWLGITWPSAIITLVLGLTVLFKGNWHTQLLEPSGKWAFIKLILVFFLYLYHFSLHRIYKQEQAGLYKYSSQQLRMWNEVATVFLIAIVMLATVKSAISMVWGVVGMVGLVVVLMVAIKVYKNVRGK